MTDQHANWENEGGMIYKDAPANTHDGTPQLNDHFTVFDAMMAWENGNISEGDAITLFQYLVDTGQAWTLQGMYGRQAKAFLDANLITLPPHGNVAKPFNMNDKIPAEGISDFYAMGGGD